MSKRKNVLLLLLRLSWWSPSSLAFTALRARSSPFSAANSGTSKTRTIFMSREPQYDMTKPTFDIYTLRGVRGDALAKYNSLNQSEPLRINLSLLFAFLSASYPWLSAELGGNTAVAGQMPPISILSGSALATVLLGANFVRECRRRSRQLTRLEKELQALQLSIRMPQTVWADAPYQSKPLTIKKIQAGRTLRVLALYGSASQVLQALEELNVFGQRLVQSETIVVPIIASDDDNAIESNVDLLRDFRSKGPWLAAPDDKDEWRAYFAGLGNNQNKENDEASADTARDATALKWFGLSATGRSFGSGSKTWPSWIQLFGQHLRPTVVLDADEKRLVFIPSGSDKRSLKSKTNDGDDAAVLNRLREFYQALVVTGNVLDLTGVFATNQTSTQVTAIMQQGGRLDPWSLCLQDGNRPVGMRVANADVTFQASPSLKMAYSTVIEFPDVAGTVECLLAQQTWMKEQTNGDWKLVQHQTIPWSDAAPAGGILVCDIRGCVSMVRTQ